MLKQQADQEQRQDDEMAVEGVKREGEAEVVQQVEKATHQSLC